MTEEYASALRGYFEGAGEDALMRAYQVGRSALKEGFGVLQLAAIHQEALVGVLLKMLTAKESQRIARGASEFFLESLAPFEMSQRGVKEANDLLEDLNTTLGRLVEERTAELERTLLDLTKTRLQVTEHEKIERMKDEFIALVSHELRTPMTSVHGCLDLIRSGQAGDVAPDVANLVDIAFRNSEHLVRLVTGILDLTKIEAGRMTFVRRPVDLSALLPTSVEANTMFARRYDVTLVLEPVPPGAWVLADGDRLLQVMTNLLGNAA
ncbi:MAG TPA: histidine kinase dimerization/phospho-acceptor domain-containing protein, partial [Thermoanaerobaculia bacterium]|nr:histidine kinase dimerization/phospho-acceptor domain-containing protein [Thermoanaerobaculia bacterium]